MKKKQEGLQAWYSISMISYKATSQNLLTDAAGDSSRQQHCSAANGGQAAVWWRGFTGKFEVVIKTII